jgi:hypothetical protein
MFGLGKETAFLKTTTDDYIELLKDRKYDAFPLENFRSVIFMYLIKLYLLTI